jgi:AAA family ATP:ADP antiporter
MNLPVGSLLDWRPGERRLVLSMALGYFLFLLFFYLLKPARDALFLVNLEPTRLPWVYILTALLAAPLVAAHARAGSRMRLERLTTLTLLALMVSLTVMRLLLEIEHDFVYYLFYGVVAVAGGVTTSQFWLMASAVFDSVQARRLFPVLAVGGIAGAWAGGEITGFLVDFRLVDTRNLVLAATAVLGAAGLVTLGVWRSVPLPQERQPVSAAGDPDGGAWSVLKLVGRSRHLSLTVLIILLSVMVGSLVDYQFMAISWESYGEQAQLTSFLGRFYGRVSLVALLVQMMLTGRILRRLGAGGVLFILPGFLLLGSAFILVSPGLLAGMLLRGSDLSLKYSLDKTSRELLFMPVPLALKKRTKVFLDTLVDRMARGLAGALLLLCTLVWGLELSHVAVITLVLVLLWLAAAYKMRQAYIDSFRQAVTRRHVKPSELQINVGDSSSRKTLERVLSGGSEREILYALRLLADAREPRLLDLVRPRLQHPSAEIRRLALAFLTSNGGGEDQAAVEALLDDPELEVRVAAIGFLARHRAGPSGPGACLAGMLAASPASRNAALVFLGRSGDRQLDSELGGLVNSEVVRGVLADRSRWAVEGRIALAGLPWQPAGTGAELWDGLLRDPEPAVVAAAIDGIGRRGEINRAPWLLKQLDQAALHVPVRRALVALAEREPEMVAQLEAFLRAAGPSLTARREIPRILAGVPSQAAVQVLLTHLATHIPEMRYQSLKALNRLRQLDGRLEFDGKTVAVEINLEASRYLQLVRVGRLLAPDNPRDRLLVKVLNETQQLRLESVFRLMGLMYPAAEVAGAHARLTGPSRIQRANALEFLDNILSDSHRALVRALVLQENLKAVARSLQLAEGSVLAARQEALDFLSLSCDPWLAACARFAGAQAENPAADVYLNRKAEQMLTPVERVLILQEVDVFKDLPTDLLAALATLAQEEHFLAGDILFRQDDQPDAMYVVLEGEVDLHQNGQKVMTSGKGQHVGLWALFHDEPRPMTATVAGDSLLLRVDQDGFNDLLSGDVRLARSMMKVMARYLMGYVNEFGWRRPGPMGDPEQAPRIGA